MCLKSMKNLRLKIKKSNTSTHILKCVLKCRKMETKNYQKIKIYKKV